MEIDKIIKQNVKIEEKNGRFSYRINKSIKVEGIKTREDAIESIKENLEPLIKLILKNRSSIKQF